MTRLADLNPEFVRGVGEKGYLSIDCPKCRAHRIPIPTLDSGPKDGVVKRWGFRGNPPDWDSVSVTPSIGYAARQGEPAGTEHCHFTITNGAIQ